jgi:hypothetical protein
LEKTLTSPEPITLNFQKTGLVLLVIIVGILATLAIAFLTILLVEAIKACKLKLQAHRRKHKFELIPTYHNVRVLKHTFDPEFENYSEETLPPPPTAPTLEYEFDTNVVRRGTTVITFKDGQDE